MSQIAASLPSSTITTLVSNLTEQSCKKSYSTLYTLFFDDVCISICLKIKDFNHAEDLATELLFSILDKIQKRIIAVPQDLRAYIARSVANKCNDVFRKKERLTKYLGVNVTYTQSGDNFALLNIADSSVTAIDALTIKEKHAQLHDTITNVIENKKHREIIRLRYFEQKKYREIAELLNISVGTVKSGLHTALKLLKQTIN